MSEHLLLKKAFVYPAPKQIPTLSGCEFDSEQGFWLMENGTPMILDNSISKPSTKKADMETGEDQKGE